MFHKKDLFSTQIHYKALKNEQLLADLKKEAYQLLDRDQEGHLWSEKNYPYGYTSYGSNQSGYDRMHLVSSTFEQLKKKIDKQVQIYTQNIGYDLKPGALVMTHCWVNVMGPGARHAAHIHPLSVISGTYYVQVTDKSSCLRFEDPRMGLFMNSPLVSEKAAFKFKRLVDLKPKNGSLVLFESWLKHEVPVVLDKKDRISISFNYGWSHQ